MKIENQVCSLKLSKRLEELGVKRDSLFYWIYDTRYKAAFLEYKMPTFVWEHNDKSKSHISICFVPDFEVYSAFTVAELGEILPEDYVTCRTEGMKDDHKYKKYWLCYDDVGGCDSKSTQMEETEADARAKMLIYLLENKLMELPNE